MAPSWIVEIGTQLRRTTGQSKAYFYKMLCLIRRRFNGTFVALLISVCALLISAANCYFSFFWHPQDFRVYLRFPEPLGVGTNALSLNYFFANRGGRANFIEDVSILELWINSEHLNTSGAELNLCKDLTFFNPGFLAIIPSENRRSHVQMKDGSIVTSFRPTKIFVDGIENNSPATAVESGKIRLIATTFETDPMPHDKYNTIVICPAIRFL